MVALQWNTIPSARMAGLLVEPGNRLIRALVSSGKPISDAELGRLQQASFSYFLHETNPDNGLVIDKTAADWPASIAATGLALAAYPVAVERGFMPRAAVENGR